MKIILYLIALASLLSPAAHAESVLRAFARAHEAQFNSTRKLGQGATADQLNAARQKNYAPADQAFQAEHKKIVQAYKQAAKSKLARLNEAVAGLLKGGPAAAGDKLPGQVMQQQAAKKQNVPRPVTAVGGPKGANKVKFGSEKTEAVVIDGIVQDVPTSPSQGDPNVVDGINQDGGAPPPAPAPHAAKPSHDKPAAAAPATDDSGIVQDR